MKRSGTVRRNLSFVRYLRSRREQILTGRLEKSIVKKSSKRFSKALGSLLGLGLIVGAVFAPVSAEPNRDRGQYAEKMMERMSEKLNLTAEQQTQIRSIVQQQMEDGKALREQMRDVYTDEQRRAMRDRWKSNRERPRGERPSREEWQRQFQELGVTPEQQAQMKEYREQMRAHRQQTKEQFQEVLTEEQQAQLQEMKSQWKGRKGPGKHRHRGGR